jgi:hypothetical protein
MYDREKLVQKIGGPDKLRELIEVECITYEELNKLFETPNMSRRVSKSILDLYGIKIPYPRLTTEQRKWKVQWEYYNGEYWKSNFIVKTLKERLKFPIINYTGNTKRYVVACKGHPRASSANQVKAHIVLWELHNKRYLEKGEEVSPIDKDFTNLSISNFLLTSETERKSKNSSGIKNHFYVNGSAINSSINYKGNWEKLSKEFRKSNNSCKICEIKNNLVVHHIIYYRLFRDKVEAHNKSNLITLCNSCHGKIHSKTIKLPVGVTQHGKLLELLETLKSQVPDTDMETLLDIEKQLELTDNQQPSP